MRPLEDVKELNKKRLERVYDKLSGMDILGDRPVSVMEQVDNLNDEAMDPENLVPVYKGWQPYW